MTEEKLKLLDTLAQELGELSDEEFAKGIERLDKIFKSGQVEVRVMPNEVVAGGKCCNTCINYEIYSGANLKNFCSMFCIYMNKLHSWKTDKDYCNRYEKSQREA